MVSYRPDIDGLRGIAVLAVVLYHLGLGPLRGGFVGVDIFFVISGFLITGIIRHEIEQGYFTISGFYERRIRRLFPALIVVLSITFVVGAVMLLPSDLVTLGKSLIATLLFGSNIYFWRESGYFDTASEINPLLHIWSLAVEEQFYVGYPVLLLLAHRYARGWLKPGLLIVCVVSFLLCVGFQSSRPSAVFYLAPFRAWELMVGALLAVGGIPVPGKRWQREILSAIGLTLVIYSIVTIDPGIDFPGWVAALPVLGTAALIHSGTSGASLTQKILRLPALVYVGLISYSLYLWHWPMVAYGKYQNDFGPLGNGGWVILAASLLLAALSHRFVEKPFRRRTNAEGTRAIFTKAAIAVALLASLGVSVNLGNGWAARFGPDVVALDRERQLEIPFLDCIDRSIDSVRRRDLCHVGAPGQEPVVLVWGDSYALAWLPVIDEVLRKNGIAGIFAARSACPPLVGVRNPVRPYCLGHNSAVTELWKADERIRLVVMAASWVGYSTSSGQHKIEDTSGQQGNDIVFPLAIRKTIHELRQAERTVWLIGPTPGAPSQIPLRMAMARLNRGGNPDPISVADFNSKKHEFYKVVSTLPRDNFLILSDPSTWICDGVICKYEVGGMPIYRDGGHLNVRGALYLQNFLEQSFPKGFNNSAHN